VLTLGLCSEAEKSVSENWEFSIGFSCFEEQLLIKSQQNEENGRNPSCHNWHDDCEICYLLRSF